MRKRVLLTGVSGFVGSNVLEYLLEHTDWSFVCPCSWKHRGNPLRINPKNNRVSIVTMDITAPIPDLGKFDYIINLASESHVDRSIKDPTGFVSNNVMLMLRVLEYARNHGVKKFLQFSTDEVYGATHHKEWDILLPSNPYAASKGAQELLCIADWKTFGTPVIITNSNNIIGKNQDREKVIPKFIDLIARDQELTIHVGKNGKPGRRYYNPVENIADALLFILSKCEPATHNHFSRPDRYSLPGGESLDNLELAQKIAALLGKELKYKLVDAETIRPGYDDFYPEPESEIIEYGWKPVKTFDQSLKELVGSYNG